MSAKCAECGEALLGSVNRCWICGTYVVEIAATEDEPVVAALVDEPGAAATVSESSESASAPSVSVESRVPAAVDPSAANAPSVEDVLEAVLVEPAAPQPMSPVPPQRAIHRRGSPFQTGEALEITRPTPGNLARPALPQERIAAKGGAVGALVLGILALLGALLTAASSITATIGIGMGIWGLFSTKKRMAAIGMILCGLAIILILTRGLIAFAGTFSELDPMRTSPPSTTGQSP